MKYFKVSGSSLDPIMACPLQAYYNNELRITLNGPQDDLQRGSLMHHMLETHYRFKKEGVYDYDTTLGHVITSGLSHSLSLENMDDDLIQACIEKYKNYHSYYRGENWIIDEVEQPFSKKLYEVPDIICEFCTKHGFESAEDVNCEDCKEGYTVLYEGKIDLLIRIPDLEQKGQIVVDHKCPNRNYPVDPRSNQFIGYSYALGSPTVIINKLGFQKDEKLWFTRPFVSYDQDQIQDWLRSAIYYTSQYLGWKKDGVWIPNYTSCSKYGGCAFASICNTSRAAREFIISSLYRPKTELDLFRRK